MLLNNLKSEPNEKKPNIDDFNFFICISVLANRQTEHKRHNYQELTKTDNTLQRRKEWKIYFSIFAPI